MKNIMLLVFVLISNSLSIFAQDHPGNDINWIKNDELSDEFDNLNKSKWIPIKFDTIDKIVKCCNWGGNSRFEPDNVSVSNGKLILQAEPPDDSAEPPYSNYFECCGTGGVKSNENYGYGFYEILAKLPGNYHNGVPNGQKFWPAFWTYYQQKEDEILIKHDEIDILEPSGVQYADAKTNVYGWWDENNNNGNYKAGQGSVTSPSPLFEGYHKFAVEWFEDRMVFYFDDKIVYNSININHLYNHSSFYKNHDQRVVIDLQIDELINCIENNQPCDFNSSIVFPDNAKMEVEYFRYYQLATDCGTDVNLYDYSDINDFKSDPAVKRNFNIGDGVNALTLNTNENVTLRATNEIKLNHGFTAPLGAELRLIPTPCN